MTGLTKKEIARTIKDLRGDISTLIKDLDPLFKDHKTSCDLLRASVKEYNTAKATIEKKDNSKNAQKLESRKEELKGAYGTYLDSLAALTNCNKEILEKYDQLIKNSDSVSEREQAKATAERESFKSEYDLRLEKAERGVVSEVPDFILAMKSTTPALPEASEKPSDAKIETAAPSRPVPGTATPSVSVAPVSIDITAYVERAISAAMERLSVGMEKRIDAYVSSFVLPTPTATATATLTTGDSSTDALTATTRANNELMTHLLEEQTHIYEKLRTMITNVQGLVDGMTDLSAAYMSLSEKEKEAIETQKRVNDMQRHVAREQQGVQVNQKLIAEEQIAISAEQSLLGDRQKVTLERQATLLESQKAMEESQKALLETHHALEEAMRSVMQAQKDIIATQQAIISGNAKNIDTQKAIMEKQSEIAAAQKEALAAQKQLLREQKTINEKLPTAPTKAKKSDETD